MQSTYNRTVINYSSLVAANHKKKYRINKILLTQKLLSIILIAFSIVTVKLLQDATITVLLLPLAFYLMFTKNEIIEL